MVYKFFQSKIVVVVIVRDIFGLIGLVIIIKGWMVNKIILIIHCST